MLSLLKPTITAAEMTECNGLILRREFIDDPIDKLVQRISPNFFTIHSSMMGPYREGDCTGIATNIASELAHRETPSSVAHAMRAEHMGSNEIDSVLLLFRVFGGNRLMLCRFKI